MLTKYFLYMKKQTGSGRRGGARRTKPESKAFLPKRKLSQSSSKSTETDGEAGENVGAKKGGKAGSKKGGNLAPRGNLRFQKPEQADISQKVEDVGLKQNKSHFQTPMLQCGSIVSSLKQGFAQDVMPMY